MLIFRTDSNFYSNARQVIVGSEGFRADIYPDSVKIPTIGYGYALIVKAKDELGNTIFKRSNNIESDFSKINISFNATQLSLIDSIAGDLNNGDKTAAASKIETLDTQIRDISLSEAGTLFNFTFDRAMEHVEDAFIRNLGKTNGEALFTKMTGSTEMIAVVDLAFNGGSTLIGKGLSNALWNEDRAEAWYQIRYASNGGESAGPGIAKRRYYESETFGLYDNPANVSDAEYKSALQMYTRHQQAIEIYEKQYGVWNGQRGTKLDGNGRTALEAANQDYGLTGTALQVDGLQQEFKSARDRIIQIELTSRVITATIDGDVLIGQDTDYVTAKQTWSQNDNLTGGDKNDLILGEDGNDTLEGGKGNDILIGGNGYDTYIWNTGDGSDTIIDEDKQGVIKINNGNEQDLYALGAFIETTPGSNVWQKTMADDSLLTLTHHSPWRLVTADGSEIILGDDWQPGDFGIHTVTQSSVTTHLTVTGDFKPLDQDPNTEGMQISYDALGNLITDPEQPDPDRQDTLYDSTGNDRLKGFAGNDRLDARRGGNDLLEGGAGSDILAGGAGDDLLYAEAEISLADALAQADTQATSGLRGDWLFGGEGDDSLVGEAGNDLLLGGSGQDLLIGGAGDDNLFGDLTGSANADWEVSRSITTRNNVTTYTLT